MTQDQHSIEGLMALISEYGHCRWSEGSSSATHLDHMGEQRSREEAADLYKQIESYAAHLQQRPLPVSGEGVLVLLKRPEGYEDVHPELLLQDANINPAFEPEIVSRPLPVREGTDERMRHDYPILQQFHTRHALGAKAAPSCLCCGQQTHPITRPIAVQHMELPAIVVCKQCKDASAAPSLPVRKEPTAWLCCGSLFHSYAAIPSAMLPPNGHPVPLFASSPSVQNMGEGETGKDGVDVPLEPSAKGGA